MNNSKITNLFQLTSKNISKTSALVSTLILSCSVSIAEAAAGGSVQKINDFTTNIIGILNAISVTVVTVALMFCGYQITFGNKRMSDVAPIFIGALIVGAAGQIAVMIATPA